MTDVVQLYPPAAVMDPEEFIGEAQAYIEYGRFLRDKELRKARQAGTIGYLKKRSTFLYARKDVWAYIMRDYHSAGAGNPSVEDGRDKTCETTENSGSGDIGSTAKTGDPIGTATGMTPTLAELAGQRLTRPTSAKPKSALPRSSSKKAAVPQTRAKVATHRTSA